MSYATPTERSPTIPDHDVIRAFFETDAYLTANPLIPIRARLVGELLSEVAKGRILDLGCGDGAISLPLLTRSDHLTLVDRSNTMLDRAKARTPYGAPVEFVQADVLDYAPDGLYDAVLCVGVVAHVASVTGLVTRVAEAVSPGGLCIIQITDDAQPLGHFLNRYARVRRAGWSRNEMTVTALVCLASQHHLDVVAVRRYGLALPGTGVLPYGWRLRLEEVAATSALISRLSAELIVCFRRKV
jgi:predicted TPR repeat methyltransferase